jgi:hypothetical protein
VSLADKGALNGAVAEWLYRTGDTALAARADDFVTLFEAEFTSDPEMRTAEMEEIDTISITSADIQLPDGYLEMIRLQVLGAPINQQNVVLDYVSPAYAAELDATTNTTGVSKYYTVIANRIFITPQQWYPSGATLQMAYYKFAPLTTGGTNWLLTKYPNIYLYGALMQAAAYIDDKDTTALWATALANAMAKLSKSDRKKKVGAGPLVVRASAGFRR